MTEVIMYDGKNMTYNQIKEEINKFNAKLHKEKREENYKQFYHFCNKLEEGALIWKWGGEYEEMFGGFHSKKMSFHGTIAREILESHGMYLQNETSDLCTDGSTGNLPYDCNFVFYYVAESEIKLIEEIYDDLVEYLNYQDFVNKLKPSMKNLINVSRNIDCEDEQLQNYIDDYFEFNMDKYKYVKLN